MSHSRIYLDQRYFQPVDMSAFSDAARHVIALAETRRAVDLLKSLPKMRSAANTQLTEIGIVDQIESYLSERQINPALPLAEHFTKSSLQGRPLFSFKPETSPVIANADGSLSVAFEKTAFTVMVDGKAATSQITLGEHEAVQVLNNKGEAVVALHALHNNTANDRVRYAVRSLSPLNYV